MWTKAKDWSTWPSQFQGWPGTQTEPTKDLWTRSFMDLSQKRPKRLFGQRLAQGPGSRRPKANRPGLDPKRPKRTLWAKAHPPDDQVFVNMSQKGLTDQVCESILRRGLLGLYGPEPKRPGTRAEPTFMDLSQKAKMDEPKSRGHRVVVDLSQRPGTRT